MRAVGGLILGLLGAVVGFGVSSVLLYVGIVFFALRPTSQVLPAAVYLLLVVLFLGGATLFGALLGIRIALREPDPKPGHCRCGYNLTGNVTGVCSECGSGVAERRDSAPAIDGVTIPVPPSEGRK